MGGQRPGPYDRPMIGGPREGFFGPGPGRGGALMDTMRSGGGYGGGRQRILCIQEYQYQIQAWKMSQGIFHKFC